MDESRKQFHEYMLDRPGAVGDDIARKLKDGDYVHIETQLRWEAWQASRKYLEIEIPELKMLKDYLREVSLREREDLIVGCKLEFHRKLKELGIKIKGA